MSKKKFKILSSYAIIMAIVILVAILSWVLPGGAYEYVDPEASKLEPVAGTYHVVDANPQGLGAVILAPINGFMDSVDIILYTLVIGGYLAVVMSTGAIDAAIGATIRRLKGRERLLIPVLMLIFSFAGAAFGIEEETLPFFPVLIPVLLAAGYDTLVGLSVIKMGAALGVMGIFGETPELPDLPLPAVLLLLAALAAGATYVSFRVSVRFYRKRQNGAYT